MSNVYTKIKDDMINGKLISDDSLLNYVSKRIDEEDLYNYVSDLEISYLECSEYSYNKKRIIVCPIEIFSKIKGIYIPSVMDLISKKERNEFTEKNLNSVDDLNSINIYNLISSNHEITHSNQIRIIQNPEDYMDNEFDAWRTALLEKNEMFRTLDLMFFNENIHYKFHNYFFDEYDADISAYLEVLATINSFKCKELNEIVERLNKIIALNLKFLYRNRKDKTKLSTPSKNMIDLYHKLISIIISKGYEFDIENIRHFDIYRNIDTPKDQIDRIRLGLSLNSKTCNHIDNVATGKTKTLNIFDDIRNIKKRA